MATRGTISLIVKGPIKSAKRAGARYGVPMESCRVVGTGKWGSELQCYARCKPSTNRGVAQWFGERGTSKAGRGYPPGSLLYHGAFCGAGSGKHLGGKTRKRRRR